ncbi:MAG TPA: adenylate/guanylate cyclase domain-containing protein [Candidatus Binatia bacterium]|nr:adenylate/guanylate cyclase domain-containing protein [Candidatus Binatia bacterium]
MGNETYPARPILAGVERKLAALLSADVKGYSRLMGADEVATLRTLTAYRKVMDTLIEQHRGRIVGTAGDSVLAEFASVVDAVQCGVVIQTTLKAENANLPPDRRMEFRIGINLGDVMVEGEQIYGDGVNIAARLESLAEPGGICISGTVHEHVKNKLALRYEDLGEQEVKNIVEPVRVFRVVLDIPSPLVGEGQGEGAFGRTGAATPPYPNLPPQGGKEPKRAAQGLQKSRRVGIAYLSWAVVGFVFIAGTIIAVRYLSLSTPSTQPPLSTQDSALRTQEAPALPLPDKPSIVVLPFVNMSEDSKQDYFSDGITEDLTSDLSKISSLFVISRNSAFTYKGKAVKVQDISRELGVQYVLEGSMRRAGDQVRITAQLIDAAEDHHLWTERYDRPLKDIFTLQDEIVQKIVTTLRLQLTLEEQGYIVRKTTDSLEAYDYLLRATEYRWRFTKEANAQAQQVYEKAIAQDPQYAEAYARLGMTYLMEWDLRWSPDPQNLERALESAQRAIALDDSLPVAHGLLSLIYARKKQPDQALAEGERAIALDPNDADSYVRQAEVLGRAGRPEEAIKFAEKAMRLNPRYPAWYLVVLGWAYHSAGRYEEAIAALKQTLLRNPNFLPAYLFLSSSYVLQWACQLSQDPQTLEQALAAAQRLIALNDSFFWGHQILGIRLYSK